MVRFVGGRRKEEGGMWKTWMGGKNVLINGQPEKSIKSIVVEKIFSVS